MKEFFRNTIAFSLALLVLLSTMSFTINKHFCGDILVSTSVVTKATSCGMDSGMDLKQIPMENGFHSTFSKNCCKDDLKLMDGQSELNIYLSDFELHQQYFIASFILSYIDLFEGLDTNIIPFKEYSPPLVVKDIQLLDEVFLI